MLCPCLSIYLSIYISTYIAPLQGNYPGSSKEESLEELIKRTGKVPRQRTNVREKAIPNRGTHNRESPFCLVAMRARGTTKSPLDAESVDVCCSFCGFFVFFRGGEASLCWNASEDDG